MEESDRHILITGVSKGLGGALARSFIALGHRVSGCARSEAALAELRDLAGDGHCFAAVDVADDARVADWASTVLGSMGAPDLILNNAALINGNANLWDVDPVEFSQVVDVNIKGTFYVLRHFLPTMCARGSGVIVNFSSGWGRSTSPQVAPYCATKWAIEGLTRALADELPPGLAAVALNPGVIHTEMLESCFGASASSYPDPESWAARAVPFLLQIGSADNGQPLTVPG